MSGRRMWAVVALVAVVAIAAAVIGLLRGDDDATGAQRPEPTEPTVPGPAHRLSGQDAGAIAERRPGPPPEPADASTDFTVPPRTAALVDDAHEHLQDAARPCPGRVRTRLTGKDLFLQFSYTLKVEGGQARPADLAVQNTDMVDPALVSCIVEELEQARWIAGAARDRIDASVTVDDTLTLGELR